MRRRWPLLALVVLVVLAGGALLARFLGAEGAERGAVVEAVERAEGAEVEVLRLDSATAYALGDARGPTRIAYRLDGETRVRCVDVLRRGGPLSADRVSVRGVSEPIGLEAPC